MEVWGREWTEEWERANTCMFGCSCRDALNCAYLHSPEELQLFRDEKELRVRKLAMRYGFCVRGGCRFGPCFAYYYYYYYYSRFSSTILISVSVVCTLTQYSFARLK